MRAQQGEKVHEETVKPHPGEKVDSLVKRIAGLTSHQAYQLKVHGKTEFVERDWLVTVTLSKD